MNFVFIGYGSIAKKHIKAITNLFPDAKFTLVRRKNNLENEDENGNFFVATSFDQVKEVDFFFITNPTYLHLETIEKVLEFKKPIFIEKPLTSSLELIEGLIKRIDEGKVVSYIGCNMRFHVCMDYLKNKLIPSLKINEVNVYCGSYLPEWRVGSNYKESYSANASMGGGVHLDVIHELDYCYYLFGSPVKNFKILTGNSTLQINSVDYAHYLWQYHNFSVQITLNYFRRDYKRTLEIVAEDATYLIDFKKGTIEKDGTEIFSGDADVNLMYQRQVSYFVDSVKNNKKCFNDISEAYNVLKLCLNESN